MTTVLTLRETREGETRVALVPETAKKLAALGLAVRVERGAGERAGFHDELFRAAGAELAGREALGEADLVLALHPPEPESLARLRRGALLVSFVYPARAPETVAALRDAGVSTLAMDLVPRITRAQAMDALSSQATVAGYKAVLLAAVHLPRLCPLLMTAAGTVPAARAVVFGAGVAGLQAIATAKRLGCVVEATDVRRAVKEQIESLGARFIDVPGAADQEGAGGYAKEQSPEFLAKQRTEVAKRVAEADLVITTAQVPGKRAPVLVSADMVRSMKPGSVIVDLAVDAGGNCELSEPGKIVQHHGVTIVGLPNLAATIPRHASELYARNVLNLVKLLAREGGKLELDRSDEVIAGCLLTHAGEITHAPTAQALAG
jgi:NAD(P) transhydrogenase subunit alpha